MINNLLEAFKEMLTESDWMDLQSKKVALEKVTYQILLSKKHLKKRFYNTCCLYFQGQLHRYQNRLFR